MVVFIVRRSGEPNGYYTHIRGGVWYEIVSPSTYPITNSTYFSGFYNAMTGERGRTHMFLIDVERPVFFSVHGVKDESSFPMKLYAYVFRLPPKQLILERNSIFNEVAERYPTYSYERKSELVYAIMENRIIRKLKSLGYDAVILITEPEDELLFSGDLSHITLFDNELLYFGDKKPEPLS